MLSTLVSHLLGGSTGSASLRTGGADAPVCSPGRQHRGELTEQSRKACLVEGSVRDQEKTSIFRHINLMLSMKGNKNKFQVPGLCGPITELGFTEPCKFPGGSAPAPTEDL